MILVLSLLTPFTMSDSLSVFFGFRVAQTRLMLSQLQTEGGFGRLCQSQPFVGLFAGVTPAFLLGFLPAQLCTCGLHTSTIFSPNSTLGQLPIMYLTESTVALGSTSSLPGHDKLVQAEFGENNKISLSGLQSLFSPAVRTTDVSNLL